MLPFGDLPPTYRTSSKDDSSDDTAGGILAAIFSLILVLLAVGWANLASKAIDLLFASGASNPVFAAAIGAICVLFGRILFSLRERRRDIYAWLELGTAFGLAVEVCMRPASTSQAANSVTLLFALFGAVYVAVRGFDNLKQAQKP